MSEDTLVSRTINRFLNNKLVAWIVIPVVVASAAFAALKTGIDIKNTFTVKPSDVSIINVVTGEQCLWSEMRANTSRGDQVNAERMGIYEIHAPKFPLYTGQISLNRVPNNRREEVINKYTIDPIFDLLLLNNSSDAVVITSATLVVTKTWSEPKAMPKGGRLKVQDMIIIQTKSFSGPTHFTISLKDPIQLPPKTPYRFLVWLKDLDQNTPDNELLVRIELGTSAGPISTDEINLSFV